MDGAIKKAMDSKHKPGNELSEQFIDEPEKYWR